MRPQDFKRWRKAQHLSQKQAAEALGLKRRVVQYYEKGERDGEKVKIPRTVRLACAALSHGLGDWQPEPAKPAAKRPAKPKAERSKAARAKPEKARPKRAARAKGPK
jgi:transcriptional regulator with XRE-family HTH domain